MKHLKKFNENVENEDLSKEMINVLSDTRNDKNVNYPKNDNNIGHVSDILNILKKGFDINTIVDKYNNTCIMYAHNIPDLKCLIENGADISLMPDYVFGIKRLWGMDDIKEFIKTHQPENYNLVENIFDED